MAMKSWFLLSLLIWFTGSSSPCFGFKCEPKGTTKEPPQLGVELFEGLTLELLTLREVGFRSPQLFLEQAIPTCGNERAARFQEGTKLDAFNACYLVSSDPVPSRQPESVEIEVYFHILTDLNETGSVSQQVVDKQMEVLNAAFAQTPFRFVLKDVDCSKNDSWFKMVHVETPTQIEHEAKKELKKGDRRSLNIYTVQIMGALGWTRVPWEDVDEVDGVVVGYTTLPDGLNPFYNAGDTAVHEVGHWLGLFHTHKNACDPPGDCVDDTPFEKTKGLSCDQSREPSNFCSGVKLNPIENYMDCTPDACRIEFTPRQVARMDAIHFKYRR